MTQRMQVVDAQIANQRLDAACAQAGIYASRSAAAKMIEEGSVFVNGEVAAKKTTVKIGDVIVYEVPEAQAFDLVGQDIPLDIRFEDLDLLVLSKQVGLVCHPSVDHSDGTLVNALLNHCGADNLCNVQGEDDDRLGIVHRLDRDTSGLMLAAKTDEAGLALMEDIRARAVDRHYLALVHGVIPSDSGMIDAPITRHAKERLRMAVRDVSFARDAMTTFKVLERFEARQKDDGYTLVDCKLFTGRTHQIRVHMEYVKHPLVGDPVYTNHSPKAPVAQLGLKRQFLHSYRLAFNHPITEERLSFTDNLPDDLREVLTKLQDRSRGRTEAGEKVFAKLEQSPYPSIQGEVPQH